MRGWRLRVWPGAAFLLACAPAPGSAPEAAAADGPAQVSFRFVASGTGWETPCDWRLFRVDDGEVASGEAACEAEVRLAPGRYRLEAHALFGEGEASPLELEVTAGECVVREVAVGTG